MHWFVRRGGRPLAPFALLAAVAFGCKHEGSELPGDLSVAPESLDLGTVGVGSEGVGEVTLTNDGGGPVSLLSLTLTSGDPDVWVLDRNGVDEVAGGTSEVILVRFGPENEGQSYTAQMQVRTDNPDPSSFVVSMAGIGGLSDADDDGDGYSVADGDCDDYDGSVHPGADEDCNGRDDDCNGIVPRDENDDDYDGWRVCDDDCDDDDGEVNPGHPEVCDGRDNDCDPGTDEDGDEDRDGFSICDGDCDDDADEAYPGGTEVCDGADNDCNGGVDDLDFDGDGFSACSSGGDCDDSDPNAHPVLVSPYGSQYGDGTEANPYGSLADGLANLDAVCRTVVVQPGSYNDVAINWGGGTATVIGGTNDPSDAVLNAAPYNRHFTVTGGSLYLQDVTLSGGDAGADGGAILVQNALVDLNGVVLSDNASATDGGALASASSTVRLHGGCVFERNHAGDDGGAMLVLGSTLDDDNSTYTDNDGERGGAVYVEGGTVSIDGAELRNNAATIEGGGIAVHGAGDFNIERSWFAANTTDGDGAGIALLDVASAAGAIRNNRFQDGTAQGSGGGVSVGGASAAIRIANNTITGNESTGEGAGIHVSVASATGLQVLSNVMHSDDGPSAVYVSAPGAVVTYNTVYLTNSGVHFAGDAGDGTGNPIDPTNQVRNPQLAAMSDDGNPDNDDLTLLGGSPEIDDGPPFADLLDQDGSQNDRGFTGGPAAE